MSRVSRRPYDRTLRDEQARATRARILEAAHRLLLADDYQNLTIAALAESAGVSVQTIYNSVGNKAAVVKAVYDVTLAGDDDPRAMNDRPEFLALADATDGPSMLRAYAALSRRIADRVGPLLTVLLTNSDDDVKAFAATIEAERLRGNATMIGHLVRRFGLPAGLSRRRAIDVVWTLTSPEVFDRLTRQRSWSANDYERWLGDAMIAALAPDVRRSRGALF